MRNIFVFLLSLFVKHPKGFRKRHCTRPKNDMKAQAIAILDDIRNKIAGLNYQLDQLPIRFTRILASGNSAGRKRAVITQQFFNGYHGSCLFAAELSHYLLKNGYDVELLCFETGDPLFISTLLPDNVAVHNVKDFQIPAINADIMFAIHPDVFDKVLASGMVSAKRKIAFSLSPYVREKRISRRHAEFDEYFANSEETKKVRLAENPDAALEVFVNCVAPEFLACESRPRAELKSIAIVSNYKTLNPESKFAEMMSARGVGLAFFGVANNFRRIAPNDLEPFDAVITIGRTVQYAMALGIPVYCYDRFGGPGYITPQNWRSNEDMNYSGRARPATGADFGSMIIAEPDAETLARDITAGWPDAAKNAPALQKIARERYDLHKNLDNIMKKIGVLK